MARDKRGVRDGSGPHRDSAERRSGGKGKRQAAGKPCPKKGK